MSSSQILVFAGHRQHHARVFQAALLKRLQRPLGGVNIRVFPVWGEDLLQRFAHLVLPHKLYLLKSAETLYLLRQFYAEQHQDYFSEMPSSDTFFWHLLRRHRRCAEGLLWDSVLEQRTQSLEFSPQAREANRFLADFSSWLQVQEPALLDVLAQMKMLLQLSQMAEVQAAFSTYTHWLIDDLDEARPIEHALYQNLGFAADEVVYTANPGGGTERLLGADPGLIQPLISSSECEVIYLERCSEQHLWAQKFSAFLRQSSADLPEPLPHAQVRFLQHPTGMYEAMAAEVKAKLQLGVPIEEILCLSWALDEISCRHLKAHFQSLKIPVVLFRGQQTLQRHPLVNTLLSLVRLVCWPIFAKDPRIPRLNGFDMVQIFRFCGGLDAFALARPRFEFKDNLETWGTFMQENADSPRLKHLQDTITDLRNQYPSSGLENLYLLARELWSVLLLPHVSLESDAEGLFAIRQLFDVLERQVQVQMALGDEQADQEMILQLLRQEIMEDPEVPVHQLRGKLKIMTLYRLCELRFETDYQIWFDLTSSAWNRPVNHPLDNALLLSPSWPLDRPWTLEAEDYFITERLDSLWRKGIQYCRKEPSFYACLYDVQAQQQNFERLRDIVQYAGDSVSQEG